MAIILCRMDPDLKTPARIIFHDWKNTQRASYLPLCCMPSIRLACKLSWLSCFIHIWDLMREHGEQGKCKYWRRRREDKGRKVSSTWEKKIQGSLLCVQENCQIKAVWQQKYTKTKFNTEIKADVWN